MISKLVTLPRGTTKIPVLDVQSTNITVKRGGTFTISPKTSNFDTSTESAYSFTIADRRLISQGSTGGADTTGVQIPFTGTALSQTFLGTSFTGTALSGTTLFGSNSALATSIIIIGADTGARTTVTLQVNKDATSSTTSLAQPASSY